MPLSHICEHTYPDPVMRLLKRVLLCSYLLLFSLMLLPHSREQIPLHLDPLMPEQNRHGIFSLRGVHTNAAQNGFGKPPQTHLRQRPTVGSSLKPPTPELPERRARPARVLRRAGAGVGVGGAVGDQPVVDVCVE